MQMKKICVRTMSILTAAAVLSGGCSAWEGPSGGRLDVNPEPAVSPEPPAFEADPASFSLTVFTDEGEAVPVSLGAGEFEAADYEEGDGTVSWRYPGEGIVVEISGQDGFLQVDITAEGDGDQSFACLWLRRSATTFPLARENGFPRRMRCGRNISAERSSRCWRNCPCRSGQRYTGILPWSV